MNDRQSGGATCLPERREAVTLLRAASDAGGWWVSTTPVVQRERVTAWMVTVYPRGSRDVAARWILDVPDDRELTPGDVDAAMRAYGWQRSREWEPGAVHGFVAFVERSGA